VSESDATGYIGPSEIRDAAVVGLFRDESVLRVILRTDRGPGLTLTFRDVGGVVEKRPEGMKLAGLTKSRVGARERFVFVNRQQGDDARLEVTASGFEVSSSP
jgi:hypothetical protein